MTAAAIIIIAAVHCRRVGTPHAQPAPPRRGGLRRAGGTHDARRCETEGAP